MKKTSKALLLALCAVLLVAASVMGTMAYLTSTTGTVTNTFSVGKIAITLDEANVNADGTPVQDADRVMGNTYHLLPGHSYTKDPTVHVEANSEDSYIFVKVEGSIAAYEAATVTGGYTSIADQITANGWTALTDVEGVYYKEYTSATAQTDLTVFSSFKIADNAQSVDGWSTISTTATQLKVTAYAVQKDGFTDAKAAWDAAGFGNTTANP